MWPVSDRFREAVRNSHKVIVKAEVYSEGAFVATVYPLDGSVSVDSRRPVRRTVSLTFADVDGTLAPGQAGRGGTLTPFGSEIRVWRGISFGDGTEEYVPLGVFVVTTVTIAEGDEPGKITVEGSDRSIVISRNRFLAPYQITSGQPVETAIANLLRDRWADVQTDLPETGQVTSDAVVEARAEADGWSVARDLAEAYGYELAFDVDGVVRMRQVPDPLVDDITETYEDGSEAVLLSLTRVFDQSRTFNGVVISSESTRVSTPFQVAVWDDNPNSPTYRYGAYGQAPLFYKSPLITSAEQAAIVALAMLRRMLGRPESVEWSQIVNPAHDALDVIRVKRGDLVYVVILDRIEIPLAPDGEMTAVARSQQEV